MAVKAMTSENLEKPKHLINNRILICLAAGMVLLPFIFRSVHAETQWPRVAVSKDGTPISYEVFGTGEPLLAFVHGWSCDARYWRAQVPVFSKKHRVMVLDLAGHGHSGTSRTAKQVQRQKRTRRWSQCLPLRFACVSHGSPPRSAHNQS